MTLLGHILDEGQWLQSRLGRKNSEEERGSPGFRPPDWVWEGLEYFFMTLPS